MSSSRGQAEAPSVDIRMSFDVTASTDYCTSLRQTFTRRAGDALVTSDRTHCSAHVPKGGVQHNCVFSHFPGGAISKELVTDQ
jgi:hypothetical protein